MKENNSLEQLKQQQGYQHYFDNFKKLNTEYDDSYAKYLEKWEIAKNKTIIPWDNNESVPWTDGNDINPLDLETNLWGPAPNKPTPLEQEEYRKIIEKMLKEKEKKRVVEIKCAECGKTIAIIKRKPSDDTDEKLLCPVCYKLKKLKE